MDIDLDGLVSANDTSLCMDECDSIDCAETGGAPYIVPEPSSVLGLASGLLALATLARTRSRRLEERASEAR